MNGMRMWFGLLLTLALVAGCSDEQLNPVRRDGNGAGGSIGFGGSDATPPGDPQPLGVEYWMVAPVSSAQSDMVLPAIEDGSFELPTGGVYLGAKWSAVAPGENGELIDTQRELLYAAARVRPPRGHRIFGRADTGVAFYVDPDSEDYRRRQPGDFYHSRKMRVPLTTVERNALIVVRALGRRNTPEVELWSTDAELVLNTADLTEPDLVEGSSDVQWLGLPVLSMRDRAVLVVSAKVLEDEVFAETEERAVGLSAGATTQVSFRLEPKSTIPAGTDPLTVSVEVSSPTLAWSYSAKVEVPRVAAGERYRHTRRSLVDGSTQYYAVMPPSDPQAGSDYGLIMSLHGAGVEATGQAASYSPKAWSYLIAPTNRRPFGFDWEEWGRLDAIEALDDAMATLPIDKTRVHLTGHSMGGHGSWHVGTQFSDRFGVIAPSAGWISFELYGGGPHPDGPIGRARAASQTLDYISNLADNSVYIIHGSSDDNVPVSHAQQMYAALGPISSELVYHEEPGARHWWDLDPDEEGADCVDWEPMIDVMEARTRDPLPLDFNWKTPATWVNAVRSFVTLGSATDPMQDLEVSSGVNGEVVTLSTSNVRSLSLDGARLVASGISSVVVDGTPYPVTNATIAIGPQTGKTRAVSGPLNQVFQRPFCFVWEADGPQVYREYAAFLLSWWAVIGNGHGCGFPSSELTDELAAETNLVMLGAPDPAALPIAWDAGGVSVGAARFDGAAVAFVYPDADSGRLRAWIYAAEGAEALLFRYVPFSSRAGMPDFLVWSDEGAQANGFFDGDWKLNPAFATGI